MEYTDYLEHYGVLGMKWGVRKDPDRAYARAGEKLEKLDKKVSKTGAKAAQKEQKAMKKQAKATSAILFKRHKARVASRATRRAMKTYQKQQNREVKAYRWNEQIKKTFANTKVNNMDEKYIALGNKYSQKSIDSIMANNASISSLMNIDKYYTERARR